MTPLPDRSFAEEAGCPPAEPCAPAAAGSAHFAPAAAAQLHVLDPLQAGGSAAAARPPAPGPLQVQASEPFAATEGLASAEGAVSAPAAAGGGQQPSLAEGQIVAASANAFGQAPSDSGGQLEASTGQISEPSAAALGQAPAAGVGPPQRAESRGAAPSAAAHEGLFAAGETPPAPAGDQGAESSVKGAAAASAAPAARADAADGGAEAGEPGAPVGLRCALPRCSRAVQLLSLSPLRCPARRCQGHISVGNICKGQTNCFLKSGSRRVCTLRTWSCGSCGRMRLRQCCATGVVHAQLHLGILLQTPDHDMASAGLADSGATVCAPQDRRNARRARAGTGGPGSERPLARGRWAFVMLALHVVAQAAVVWALQANKEAWHGHKRPLPNGAPGLWMEASLWQLTLAQVRELNRPWAYGRGRPAKKRGMRRQRRPLPDVDGVWTEEALWQLTVAELRAMGRARGLPGMGSSKLIKPGIIARLLEVINK